MPGGVTAGRRYGGRTAQERLAERRAALAAAGLELFGTRPYADVSVADVVEAAGQTRRAFYECFADREALLRAVHDAVVDGQVRAMLDAAGPPPATARSAERGLRAGVAYFAEDHRRARVQFVTVVGVSAAMEEHRRATTRDLAGALAAWLGDAAGPEPQRRHAALFFAGGFSELLMDWLWRPDAPLSAIEDEIVAVLRARFFAHAAGASARM